MPAWPILGPGRGLRVRPVRIFSVSVFALSLAVTLSPAGGARAETLQDALISAYIDNPALQAQRARLRVTDETYVQVQAEFAPTVTLQGQGTYDRNWDSKDTRAAERTSATPLPDYTEQNSGSGSLVISEPLYSGGKLAADLKAADADVRAGRQALRTTEANTLYNVVLAYADMLRDQQELEIRKLNLAELQHELEEAKARLKAGEVTQTDVAQSQAELDDEQSLTQQASDQVEISRANYAAAVGHKPEGLAPLPELKGLPATIDDCLKAAERDNPDLGQALWTEAGSHARIYSARAALRPTISAQIQAGYQGPLSPYDPRALGRQVSATANVVVPLYSGGLIQSQVRQAVDQNAVDQMSVEDTHRTVTQTLLTLWAERHTALMTIDAESRRVAAAKVEFEGMRKEYSAGERSTLDVLTAEETLRDAEISVESAKHDAYVLGAGILQNMGWLEMRNLVDGLRPYNPAAHLEKVMPAGVPWQKPLEALDDSGSRTVKPMSVTGGK